MGVFCYNKTSMKKLLKEKSATQIINNNISLKNLPVYNTKRTMETYQFRCCEIPMLSSTLLTVNCN